MLDVSFTYPELIFLVALPSGEKKAKGWIQGQERLDNLVMCYIKQSPDTHVGEYWLFRGNMTVILLHVSLDDAAKGFSKWQYSNGNTFRSKRALCCCFFAFDIVSKEGGVRV